ncbi:hypothetical protein [Paenibacillus yonginensis]|uniref:hypothetical protein n=1 Tax=Paenibacillus yonginensis TaxID=1462996 RepID=UPI0008384447|nr:hypothetical protein [Paenibacillus yonginensis]
MNLAEMLTYADIEMLSKIAAHYECNCNAHSKNELIQSILNKMGNRDFIQKHVDQMGIEDLRFLNTLLFDKRSRLSLEELLASAGQAKFAEGQKQEGSGSVREMIARFRQRGWLFNGSTPDTRYLFGIPDDLKSRFRSVMEQQLEEQIVTVKEPEVYREEQEQAPEDLYLLLRYVQRHEVPLNAEGVMHKRCQTQLMEMLHVPEPLVSGAGWRFGYGRRFKDYPDRLALLYDYACHRGYLREKAHELVLTDSGHRRVEEEIKEPLLDLIQFWLRLYKSPIPNLVSLIYWISHGSENWCSAASVFGTVQRFIKPFYYDAAESIFQERIVKMMLHLGMMKVGEDLRHGAVIRMTSGGRSVVNSLVAGTAGLRELKSADIRNMRV